MSALWPQFSSSQQLQGNASVNLTENVTAGGLQEAAHTPPTAILFIFASCALGALVRTVFKRVPLPYTVLLLLLGLLVGILSSHVEVVDTYTTMARMDPHIILHVFLPVLIFESAFVMDAHMFLKSFLQIVVLAIPGLCLAAFLTAVFSMHAFDYGWNWPVAMMFGAIVSATDPVAVVALLRELGASKQLSVMIEGESLLNDGAAIVLFKVCLQMALPNQSMDAAGIVLYFLRVSLGGPLFGFVMAKFVVLWLVNIFNDALTEITITLAATYVTFYIGEEFLKVSGVLAVVVLGVTMSAERTSISPEVEAFLHRFWEMLAYLSNTLIFLLVGVVITSRAVKGMEVNDFVLMLALYAAIIAIRAMVIVLFSPLLSRIGYGMNWKVGTVMMWGGLRGAVGLALALIISQESELDVTGELQNKILLHSAGIVMLTLLINATTISKLLKVLGMSTISAAKRMAMASAVRQLEEVLVSSLALYKSDRFLADADWDVVQRHVQVEDPYITLEEEAELDHLTDLDHRMSRCPNCSHDVPNEPTKREMTEMKQEARMRLLKAQKTSYWKQFEHGMLGRESVRKLVEAVDSATDLEDGYINLEEIRKTWQVHGPWNFMIKKLQQWRSEKPDSSIVLAPKNKMLKQVYKMCMHQAFEIIIYILVFVNIVVVLWEVIAENQLSEADMKQTYGKIFSYINYVFIVLYIYEAIVKSMAFCKAYFLSHWNQFDLVILITSIVDVIVDQTYFSKAGSGGSFNPNLLKIAKTVRLLRILRSLRLVKGLIPQLIVVMNKQINKQLRFGYDIGKGYVMGEEEVYSLVDHMVDNKDIAREMKKVIQSGRMEIIKALGMLQKDHPGIAVSVKTQQAARRILNNMRDRTLEMRGEGVLDEMEAMKLEVMIETHMKMLLKMPATIQPPPPEKIIGNLAWIGDDNHLLQYIKNNAQLVTMYDGEKISAEDDPRGGLYIIVSGLVKVDGFVEDNSCYEDMLNDKEYMRHVARTHHMLMPDIQSSTSESEHFVDYLSTGSILGETALLTGKPCKIDITCDTAVQLYHVQYEAIVAALELFTDEPTLEWRLWRICAIRMAVGVLKHHFAFKNKTHDNLKMYVDKAVLVIRHYNLDDERLPCFEINSITMSDIILIYGVTQSEPSYGNCKVFVGPCYIPNTLDRLILVPSASDFMVLLIVGHGGQLVHTGSSSTSLRAGSSGMCLAHASKHRMELTRRMSGTSDMERRGSLSNMVRRLRSRPSLFSHVEQGEAESDPNHSTSHSSQPHVSQASSVKVVQEMRVANPQPTDTIHKPNAHLPPLRKNQVAPSSTASPPQATTPSTGTVPSSGAQASKLPMTPVEHPDYKH